MRLIRSSAIAALFACTALSSPALASGPTAAEKDAATTALVTLSQLNVFVKEDIRYNGGGEFEGKIWVGRDVLKTGGAGTTQAGFGASNGQGTVASTFNTVTVGRNSEVVFQFKNSVGGSYGAYIGGNSAGLEVQDNSATVKIGGSASGKISMSTGTSLQIAGSYTDQNGLSLGGNNTVWIGGNSTRIQGGNNNNIKVGGNLGSLQLDSGSAQIGGALGTDGNYSATKVSLTAMGNISKLQMNDNGLTVKSGGSISEISISNASKVYAAGSIGVQNNNGGAGAVNANCGASFASCAGAGGAPTSPGAPVIASVATETQTMYDNFKALSKSLSYLSVANNHAGIITPSNGSQAYTFSSGANTGYTVFNVDQSIFNKNEFAYNFANTTTPVIFNVKSTDGCSATLSCSYVINTKFTGNAANYNRNVIWNFVDATSVVLSNQWQGSVVAALANLQSNVIEGSIVAKNFTVNNEVHLGTYGNNGNNGNNGNPLIAGVIPEPGQWAMLIAGFGVVGGVVRRRRRSLVIAA